MSQMPRTVSFVVPALNEGLAVLDTVAEIVGACNVIDDYEIILVDDGSTDDTLAVMRNIADSRPRVVVVAHSENRGLGAAYVSGLAVARQAYYMLVPGDNCFDAGAIRSVIEQVGAADIVIPYHINADTARGVSRRVVSWAFTWLANTISGRILPYYNGIVVHRTELVRGVRIETTSFAYQVEALVKLLRLGCSFVTVGIVVSERRHGRSKAFGWRNFVQIGQVFWRLLFAPRAVLPLAKADSRGG